MPSKRVLLIESGHFIGGVISSLFSQNEQITLIEASPTSGAELIEAVREHNAQVVVIDDTLKEDYLNLLLRYMRTTSDLRVVVVEADSNHVAVYQKQKVPVRRSSDFLAII
jgi:chemotaxis response regulator CheB